MPFDFSNRKKPLDTYSLAGLTDIVLPLLVFFLLTSNFIPQFGIQVRLPRADAAASMEALYVTVAITEDGHYYVNQNRVAREALLSAIRDSRGDRTVIVLRADQNATIGQFATVANLAKALNMSVWMATERGEIRPMSP